MMNLGKKNIFIWCPFTSKVGTTNNVINSCFGLIKFSKSHSFKLNIINVFGEWDSYSEEIKKKKIEIENLESIRSIKEWKKEGFLKSRISYLLIFIFSFFPLYFLLKKKKPDYLTAHLITSLPIILYSLFNFQTKLVLHIAGHPKMTFFRKYLWKKASNKIFKIICPSIELKDYLLKNKIFDDSKIVVIQDPHLSVNKINILKNVDLVDNFFDDDKILISIGRLTKQKNYPFLINNFKKLVLKYDDIKLLIIGSGEEKFFLDDLVNRYNLKDKVKLINYEKNIYKYLKKSNYYISTSIWEGSSLAMIDAAYIGIPILCSDCPSGRQEFIGNDERGFLYKEGNEDDFISAFTKIYNLDLMSSKKKLINAKKASRDFTLFKNYLKLKNIFN